MNNFIETEAVRCYQCSSDTDPKREDLCGAYEHFDRNKHIPIDCNDEESKMPGSFCVKEVRQGPKGFICKSIFLSTTANSYKNNFFLFQKF